jgi:Zn-dependent protease with chaperone function
MFTKLNRKFYYWHFFLALLVLKYIIFCVVEVKQYLYISNPEVPADLKPFLSLVDYDRLRKQEMDSFVYGFFESFAHCSIFLLTFCFGFLGKCWAAFERSCDRLSNRFKSLQQVIGGERTLVRSLIFYTLFAILELFIVMFCLSIPSIFHIGNSSSNGLFPLSFWKIKLEFYGYINLFVNISRAIIIHFTMNKSFGVAFLLLLPLAVSFQDILELFAPAFTTNDGSSALKEAMAPYLPLLTKFKFPLNRVFIWKNYANAHIAGIGPLANMVIGTGLQTALNLTLPEMIAVVGHEMGHWVLNHLAYLYIELVMLWFMRLVVFLFLIRNRAFYRAFDIQVGPNETIPVGVGLILAIGFLQLYHFYTQPLFNYVSHICEYQADAFSVSQGYGAELLSGMIKLHPSNSKLADHLYGIFNYTHPVFSSRVAAIFKAMHR